MDIDFELEKLKNILERMDDIDNLILLSSNDYEKKELDNEKCEYYLQIEELSLERKIKKEGYTEENIKSCAKLNARRTLLKNNLLEEKKEEQKYNLSSEYIISNKTGKTIGIKYMSLSEKISTIYEHTGQIVSYQDNVINQYRNNACSEFISFLEKTTKKSTLKERYGDNWKERVAELYNEGYNLAMQSHIEKIVKNIDNKNDFEEEKNKEQVNTSSEQKNVEISMLKKENSELKSELNDAHSQISDLVDKINSIQQQSKETLQAYKDSLTKMVNINANSEQKFEYTPIEKQKILQALGIQFEYDENKRNGVGLDNDYKLVVEDGISIEQTARQMMICKNLGINVTANFNQQVLFNQDYENENQIVTGYTQITESHRKK